MGTAQGEMHDCDRLNAQSLDEAEAVA